jgi:hypothetical protein
MTLVRRAMPDAVVTRRMEPTLLAEPLRLPLVHLVDLGLLRSDDVLDGPFAVNQSGTGVPR